MTAVHPPRFQVHLPPRALTLDEVAALAADDECHRYELDEGNLLVMPPADAEHAAIITRLLVWFVTHGHAAGAVLATPGLRINAQSGGRSPDVLVLRAPAPAGTVWIEPERVLLAVEVVSPGSETLDRVVKPVEYARVGIPAYWRVERAGGRPTVHQYELGSDETGGPVYVAHHATLLDDLLAGAPTTPGTDL